MTIGSPLSEETCRLEFLIEPFTEGSPGPHVLSSLEVLRRAGLEVVLGPFGNIVEGSPQTLRSVLPKIMQSAFENGATRILLNLTLTGADGSVAPGRRQETAPADRGETPGLVSGVDHPMTWTDAFIDPTRREDLHGAVDRIVNAVESQMGGALGELPREKKQAAVRILDEQGVFLIRKSVETVAEAMGVSRITIYNYLNAIRGD